MKVLLVNGSPHKNGCTRTALNVYFGQDDCTCLDQLVLLQLKSFFLGFYDYLYRHPSARPPLTGSRRVQELFNQFMMMIEQHYIESRDVAYYADMMSITPKYLNSIVRRITQYSAKSVIDHYVILQLKLRLKTRHESIKEIAWAFHFSDVSFFCRYFKAKTGMTPQQYRKEN